MPRATTTTLIWTAAARADLIRLRSFIASHNPAAARRAAETLTEGAKLLIEHPAIGKRVEGRDDRELSIPFGQRGYVLRCRHDGQIVIVLRVWHSLEQRDAPQ